ncbi:tRNA uridine-5-carboxymethylaminomethyl(34) synthesis GTPase MnmE [Tardiphaga sp.]|uniref:tRNA uridine-5-carboxymethylaminomethyl(34) synthesis GTPase MnmE n=1 Tax=Tardiphaga sp. TaxID=1926292 RepID=UPI002634F4CE|nr:tRNA uridine-5-carboxymethylaminomethyl(34) synthesis GTPase MnmE [Tardiphaga sp.]MDB5620472.1 tRNA modification GTPase trmE [Tardiphaga sp.]
MYPRDQTIFALSSGRPPTAIAIVRVSGPEAGRVLAVLAKKIAVPRLATRALLTDASGEPIDDAVVLWFPGPASATGEDVAEFHIHGGRAVLAALFAELVKFDHVRAAEPGEFTRRAFENGKLDLTEAEGLDDLIHADTDRQRRQALRQLKGLLGDRARDWRRQIIEASALIEAGIDFSDEADVPTELIEPALERIRVLLLDIEEVLAVEGRSERLRDGLVVAITGPPNVGKSTLLNQLARREVAIVSPHAGTTRDVIELHLDLEGYPVTVIDTAGLRDAIDPVEQEGVRRARARAAEADLRLWLVDAQAGPGGEDGLWQWMAEGQNGFWVVHNKVDVVVDTRAVRSETSWPCHSISAANGRGIPELVTALAQFAAAHFADETSLISRARHRDLLRQTADALGRAVDLLEHPELIAEDLRVATHRLGQLLGRVDVEDILDVIFRDFCIGK